MRDDLNVREAEQAAQRIGKKAKKQQQNPIPRDLYLGHLADKIREKLGLKFQFKVKGKKDELASIITI